MTKKNMYDQHVYLHVYLQCGLDSPCNNFIGLDRTADQPRPKNSEHAFHRKASPRGDLPKRFVVADCTPNGTGLGFGIKHQALRVWGLALGFRLYAQRNPPTLVPSRAIYEVHSYKRTVLLSWWIISLRVNYQLLMLVVGLVVCYSELLGKVANWLPSRICVAKTMGKHTTAMRKKLRGISNHAATLPFA